MQLWDSGLDLMEVQLGRLTGHVNHQNVVDVRSTPSKHAETVFTFCILFHPCSSLIATVVADR